jgi:WD40 repeat protein
MWDVQTGGLTHTFTTQSEINDIAVSTTGDRIACGSSDGSVAFWNTHTKEEGEGFGNGQPVVAIFWLSPRKLAVATPGTVYTHDIDVGETSGYSFIPGRVWGMVYSPLDGGEFLVGALRSGKGAGRSSSFLRITTSDQGRAPGSREPKKPLARSLTRPGEELSNPMLVGNLVACITPPGGVRSFDTTSWALIGNPPLLNAATSLAISLKRNLVAETKDSIQIFSLDVLTSRKARSDARTSRVYPLGGKHIICLQPNRRLLILELETLQELRPNNNTSPLGLAPTNQPRSIHTSLLRGFVAEFGVSVVMEAWRLGTPLPKWVEAADEPLGVFSPSGARIVTFHYSPRRELRVKDAEDGTVIANLALGDDDLGEVYDIRFSQGSETDFHLKIDRPERHVQIPYEIIRSSSGPYSHTITRGRAVPLLKPWKIPQYALDANCEWVVEAGFRKICWIPPGNVRRGNGGHFWAGPSLVMVGDDGVVRKLSFKKPDHRGMHNTYGG